MLRRVSQVFKKVSVTSYYSYEDIPLKIYLNIIETNDLNLLIKKGKLDINAGLAWELITKENEAANGGNSYSIMFEHYKSLAELVAEYNEIRITLWALLYKVDHEKVDRMRELGFKIDCTTTETYKITLYNCIRNSKNYSTKIKMKRNEIDAEMPKSEQQKVSFNEVMASLTRHIGFNLPDDITLARFNAQVKELNNGRATGTNKEE